MIMWLNGLLNPADAWCRWRGDPFAEGGFALLRMVRRSCIAYRGCMKGRPPICVLPEVGFTGGGIGAAGERGECPEVPVMSQSEYEPAGSEHAVPSWGVEDLAVNSSKALADDCRLALLRQLAKGTG